MDRTAEGAEVTPTLESGAKAPHKRPGRFTMLVTDDKHLLIVSSKWRSKWLVAVCTCGKRGRRKDGSCKHIRSLLTDPRIRPEIKPRLRYVPMPMRAANELDPEEKITVALR